MCQAKLEWIKSCSAFLNFRNGCRHFNVQKIQFPKDFLSKCEQIGGWWHLLMESLTKNFVLYAMFGHENSWELLFWAVPGYIAQGLSSDRACEVDEITEGNTPSTDPAQKMKFSIKNFFSKCDQIRRNLIFYRYSQEKAVFYQGCTKFSTRNGCLAASDLFHIFTQSIKFYEFHYAHQEYRFWKIWSMVAPFSKFYGKSWVEFCLNTGKGFSLEVWF